MTEPEEHALPLKGAVLCSTSLTQDVRTRLAELASSMGGVHRLDLTTDVTHMVVGHVDTAKYRHVAKERPDIAVLRPEWVDAMRDAWKSGDDFSVTSLVDEYRLPALYGLQICVTGFEDPDQRQYLMTTIEDQGAIYNGDLTRSVTHLIANRPQGPKYDRARQWGLKVVSLKWFEESLLRAMVLDESLYDPQRPEETQGRGAFVRDYTRTSNPLSKRSRGHTGSSLPEENGKRKLRRTASSRLQTHSQTFWAEMSVADEEAPAQNDDQWDDAGHVDETTIAPPDDATTQESAMTQFVGDNAGAQAAPKRGLFSSCLFHVMGHPVKRSQQINEILQNEGGQITEIPEDLYSAVESQSHDQTILIVPSEWTANTREPMPDTPPETWTVTEWWIQRCIMSKSIINPQMDLYSRPRLQMSNKCFQGMSIASSGLGNDTKLVQSIATSAGATYEEFFKPSCSLLIVRSSATNKEKIAYAAKYRIPVVYEGWLESSITEGSAVPIGPYVLAGSRAACAEAKDTNSEAPEPLRRKDESAAQRLSATRKKTVTPSLKLIRSQTANPAQPAKNVLTLATTGGKALALANMPFVEEEEEEDASPVDDPPPADDIGPQYDGAASLPLRELPSKITNSPEKRLPDRTSFGSRRLSTGGSSHTMSYDGTGRSHYEDDNDENTSPIIPQNEDDHDENTGTIIPIKEPSMTEKTEADKAEKDNNLRLSEDIRSLLDRRKATSASASIKQLEQSAAWPSRKRKERKLGRAISFTSNPSAPASFLQSKSTETTDSTVSGSPMVSEEPMPSQQLGYETAEARDHRARMSKWMGTVLTDEGIGKRVESIGVVKDVDNDGGAAGVGSRVRGRHRNAKG